MLSMITKRRRLYFCPENYYIESRVGKSYLEVLTVKKVIGHRWTAK